MVSKVFRIRLFVVSTLDPDPKPRASQPYGSKYPNTEYIPKATIAIPRNETIYLDLKYVKEQPKTSKNQPKGNNLTYLPVGWQTIRQPASVRVLVECFLQPEIGQQSFLNHVSLMSNAATHASWKTAQAAGNAHTE